MFQKWSSGSRLMSAATSLASGALPIGLAHDVVLQRAVKAGEPVRWSDVKIDETAQAVRVRREMEAIFRQESGLGGADQGAAAAY